MGECKVHIFRQILQDFSLVNFYEMIPKLFIRLREFALFGHYSDGKERASGYTHKYQDTCRIDLNALSTFPSNTEMQEMADAAYQEAENLGSCLVTFLPTIQLLVLENFLLSALGFQLTVTILFHLPTIQMHLEMDTSHTTVLTLTIKAMLARIPVKSHLQLEMMKIILLPWSYKSNGSNREF